MASPRKKRIIAKGTASHRGGSVAGNPRTGGGVKWYKDRLVRNTKKDWEKLKKWWQQ